MSLVYSCPLHGDECYGCLSENVYLVDDGEDMALDAIEEFVTGISDAADEVAEEYAKRNKACVYIFDEDEAGNETRTCHKCYRVEHTSIKEVTP